MKCTIKWIDETGKFTPDDNEAIGFATCITTDKDGVGEHSKPYPICAEHLKRLHPHHVAWSGTEHEATTKWIFTPLAKEG